MPKSSSPRLENHRSHRSGWLRVVVLGSNDAIVSTAGLMIGIAATGAALQNILVGGIAGLVAGALSMAVGEYVSVSAQKDAEQTDIKKEKEELLTQPDAELRELAGIYVHRGLDKELAMQVAKELSAHDQLGAHLRDELGIDPRNLALPFQAAWISALSFALFASLPIIFLVLGPASHYVLSIAASALLSLLGLGTLGAYLGGAKIGRSIIRVMLGGILAMATSAAVGKILGISLSSLA